MLGLGMKGTYSLGLFRMPWLGVDVLWETASGLGLGALVGRLTVFAAAASLRRVERVLTVTLTMRRYAEARRSASAPDALDVVLC